MIPRTFFFAGKAAPAYQLAKLIIKFINNLAGTIDGDPIAYGRLKVVFLPVYCVLLYTSSFSLEMWQQRAGLGNSPRTILEELARIQSHDVCCRPQRTGGSVCDASRSPILLRLLPERDPRAGARSDAQ